ncbi:hypothetical protein EDB80DRAFT_78200 [Ilyonectria destructans]|nr:hypothetical protein EDB80DRAFT_78200 [Ilyonectria destructans]
MISWMSTAPDGTNAYGNNSSVNWLANTALSNCACSAFDILSASEPRTATLSVWVICQPSSFHTSKSSSSLASSAFSTLSTASAPSTSSTASANPAEFPCTPNDRNPSRSSHSGLQRLWKRPRSQRLRIPLVSRLWRRRLLCNNCFQVGRCARNATSARFKAGQHVASRKKTTTRCDGCWRDIKKGEMAWHCKKCWDKDLCQKCWGRSRGIVGTYHKDECR